MRLGVVVALAGLLTAGAVRGQEPPPLVSPSGALNLAAWELVSVPPLPIADVCIEKAGGVVSVTGTPTSYIATRGTFRNYRLHAEWRWTGKPGNGGVLVHISSGPKDRQWPVSYQVQLKNTAVGDILPMAGAVFGEPLSTLPGAVTPLLNRAAADSERPVGEWNACDIICRDDTIEVVINGVVQNRVTRCAGTEGRVGFQLEGTPFELRNVSISVLR